MSIFPLYKVQCGAVNPRRHPSAVVGTPNVSLGYRLRERSNCRVVKLPESFEHYEEERRREYEQLTKTLEFEEHTDDRIRRKSVWQRVRQGMAAYEDSVNERREKLREILLQEEMNLTREVVDQAQHGDDARMDEMRQRTEDLKKQQEEQRLAVVAAKKMQQYLSQCPKIRLKHAKKSVMEAKQSNLAQMADNEAKKQADKELDHLWHELMLKEVDTKKQREIEEAKIRCLANQETLATLDKQVSGKLAQENEKKKIQQEDREYLSQLREQMRKEELQRLEKERESRENLKKDLQEQILIAKRQLAERARKETEMDNLRQSIVTEELEQERRKIKESSADLRRELLAYFQYLEDLRKEEARKSLELDRIVEQSMKDAGARRDEAVRMFKEARERSLQEVLRGREEQLRIRCEREKKELEERRMEKEKVEREIEMEAKLATRMKEEERCKMLRYRKDLEEQWQTAEENRRKDAEEEKRCMEEMKQQEYQDLTEELLQASENVIPHPFKVLLRECAARYAAEHEGLCYCPPPVSVE